ncbi:MAG: NAD(P)H-hydrate dehydratase, partial [Gammaproteobacteria bacterium]|nr:NAD(P)H-hydrate dehydratase [Gammaproteobacteria bacterium]
LPPRRCAAFAASGAARPVCMGWVVCAGGGNNGGDGYVVARLALEARFDVCVIALGKPRAGGIAAAAAEAWQAAGGREITVEEAAVFAPDLIVDALFGIGLSRAPEGEAAGMIEAINAAGVPVAALDVPSGLFADTGAAPGPVVRAELTVTFIGLKPGLFTGKGPSVAGEIVFDRLGVPEGWKRDLRIAARRIPPSLADALLPARDRGAHKGLYGHVLVVGGNSGTGGAVRLAGEAAQRVGAGMVSVLTRPEHVTALLAARPELMAHATLDGTLPGVLAERAGVVALGPGLGQGEWGRRLWKQALALDKPTVLDADGLNLLAAEPRVRDNWVLTPHPGEAARLLDTTAADIERDRFAALARLVERYRAVVVLKGAGTLIGAPDDDPPYLCDRGNPGMASGGMGDALTGIIAGLLAQGLEPAAAARLGVWLHATAADRATGAGERGLLAGDVIAELRVLVNP